jgi:hypothetical protein
MSARHLRRPEERRGPEGRQHHGGLLPPDVRGRRARAGPPNDVAGVAYDDGGEAFL